MIAEISQGIFSGTAAFKFCEILIEQPGTTNMVKCGIYDCDVLFKHRPIRTPFTELLP
jgi:hypothetical protein